MNFIYYFSYIIVNTDTHRNYSNSRDKQEHKNKGQSFWVEDANFLKTDSSEQERHDISRNSNSKASQ